MSARPLFSSFLLWDKISQGQGLEVALVLTESRKEGEREGEGGRHNQYSRLDCRNNSLELKWDGFTSVRNKRETNRQTQRERERETGSQGKKKRS